MTAVTTREIRYTDAFGPVGWSGSLLTVVLIHLAFAWYFLVYHQIRVEAPPPAPKAFLMELTAPLVGPVPTPPAALQPLPQQPIMPPSAVPPQLPKNPSLAAPAPQVQTTPLPELPKLPPGEVAPLPKPEEKHEPAKPEVKTPPETKKAPEAKTAPKQTQAAPKSAKQSLPIAPTQGALQRDNPVRAWQIAVIQRLQPYMKWPDDAPYWIDQAAPVVQITIDRQGNVLNAKVVGSSGYDSFDKAARKIFKRALTLPAPPPQLVGNPYVFSMAVTFTQNPGNSVQ